MYTPGFHPPDVGTETQEVSIQLLDSHVSEESIDAKVLHLLLRRTPSLVYGLIRSIRNRILSFMRNKDNKSNIGATNDLLFKMLPRETESTEVIFKRVALKLVDLVGEEALQ